MKKFIITVSKIVNNQIVAEETINKKFDTFKEAVKYVEDNNIENFRIGSDEE